MCLVNRQITVCTGHRRPRLLPHPSVSYNRFACEALLLLRECSAPDFAPPFFRAHLLNVLVTQGVKGEEGGGEAASPAPLPETVRCLAAGWRRASAATANAHGAALAGALALALNPGRSLGSWGVCRKDALLHARVRLVAPSAPCKPYFLLALPRLLRAQRQCCILSRLLEFPAAP